MPRADRETKPEIQRCIRGDLTEKRVGLQTRAEHSQQDLIESLSCCKQDIVRSAENSISSRTYQTAHGGAVAEKIGDTGLTACRACTPVIKIKGRKTVLLKRKMYEGFQPDFFSFGEYRTLK